ncbi:HEPN domain-containing protein [Leifsonia sp. NPDC058230]|uniref:HEPN domain-containing protein n=1 Tax=Leifsonia sp. NPDC058230 TaxID=3346391 RepID=UPI0036D7E55A
MHGDPDDPQSFGVNTASPKTVSTWTWTILGWRTLEHCGWKNATNRTIKAKLDRLVTLRGDIAHGGRPDRLALANVRDYRDFTERLARAYDAELFSFVASTRSTLASLDA